jgi:hypothetical protein
MPTRSRTSTDRGPRRQRDTPHKRLAPGIGSLQHLFLPPRINDAHGTMPVSLSDLTFHNVFTDPPPSSGTVTTAWSKPGSAEAGGHRVAMDITPRANAGKARRRARPTPCTYFGCRRRGRGAPCPPGRRPGWAGSRCSRRPRCPGRQTAHHPPITTVWLDAGTDHRALCRRFRAPATCQSGTRIPRTRSRMSSPSVYAQPSMVGKKDPCR